MAETSIRSEATTKSVVMSRSEAADRCALSVDQTASTALNGRIVYNSSTSWSRASAMS